MMELHVTSVDFGAYIGANARPLIHLPTEFGAITVVDVKAAGNAAGTSIGLKVVGMSSAGTPAVNGTVGAFAGTVVWAEGVPASLTISNGVVPGWALCRPAEPARPIPFCPSAT